MKVEYSSEIKAIMARQPSKIDTLADWTIYLFMLTIVTLVGFG